MEKVEQIIKKFQNFYGKNNIVVNGLSDDKDNNGDKIDRTEIIINSKEAVTLEAYEDGEVDVIIDDVEINNDNLPLYYEFMSDEDLNTIDYDFIQNLDLAYRQHKVLGKIFETENSFKIMDLQHKFASYRLLSFKPKELLVSRTQIGIDYKIFGVKDTLKPIDEYIEEIKNSDNYKNYVGEKPLNKIVEQYDESQLNQTKIKVLDDKQIEDVIKEIDAKPIDSAENVVATIFTKDGEYDVFYRNKDSDKFFDVCKVNKEYGDYDAIDGVKFTNLTTSGLKEIKEFISNRENIENTQEETETQKSKVKKQR